MLGSVGFVPLAPYPSRPGCSTLAFAMGQRTDQYIPGADGSHARRRLTVAQAAEALGVTVDAIRSRVKCGSIDHTREDGRVYVILGDDQGAPSNDQGDDQGTAQHAPDPRDELLEELRDRVRYLEEESRRKAPPRRRPGAHPGARSPTRRARRPRDGRRRAR